MKTTSKYLNATLGKKTIRKNSSYKFNTYNKMVALDCGVVASSIFQMIMSFSTCNAKYDPIRETEVAFAYISSPVMVKLFPEFTSTQIRNALMSLQERGYITIKNNTQEVDSDFDYIVYLTEMGLAIRDIATRQRILSKVYREYKNTNNGDINE